MKVPVSVIIPVKNEKANIVKCLNSLDWADEVFVVDSQSTDGTIELAEGMGAKVVQFHFNGVYPKKKNWALDNLPIKNTWVLLADADEVFPKALQAEIREAIEHPVEGIDAYRMHFQYMFMGKPIRHCGYTGLWIPRLIKHGCAHFEKMPTGEGTAQNIGDMEIHEHLQVRGEVGVIKARLEHHDKRSLESYYKKHEEYANWEANRYKELKGDFSKPTRRQRVKYGLIRQWWFSFAYFCACYFFKRGILDGKPGYVFAMGKWRYFANIRRKIRSGAIENI